MKVAITKSIKEMELGDVLKFPIEKRTYIMNALSSRFISEKIAGKKWTTSSNNQDLTIEVRRIS